VFFLFSDELFVTAGATNGLSLISTLLFEARDNVYIEDPSFFFVFKIFKGYNFNVISGKHLQKHIVNVMVQ